MVMVVRVLALLSAAVAVAGLLLGLTVALPDCVVCLLLTVVVCFCVLVVVVLLCAAAPNTSMTAIKVTNSFFIMRLFMDD